MSKKIEIPKKCRDCIFCDMNNLLHIYCCLYDRKRIGTIFSIFKEKPEWCRAYLVEVWERTPTQELAIKTMDNLLKLSKEELMNKLREFNKLQEIKESEDEK